MPYLCNDWGQWYGKSGVLLRFWWGSLPLHYREVQHDQGHTGSLVLHGRRERTQIFQKDFGWKNARAIRETLEGEGRLNVACLQVGVTPFQVMYLCKRLSWKAKGDWASWVSRIEKRRISIFCRPFEHLHLWHPRKRRQSHQSIWLHEAQRVLWENLVGLGRIGSSLRFQNRSHECYQQGQKTFNSQSF